MAQIYTSIMFSQYFAAIINSITISLLIFSFIAGCFSGALMFVIVQALKKKDEPISILEYEECDAEYLSKEWEVTINTQMHFNDLIIRFRSIVLTVFVASIGLIYGLTKQQSINRPDAYLLLLLALSFWLSCFCLDYFYYHKLLMGAIKHAEKFDKSESFRKRGLYGLTNRINKEINPLVARIWIWTFYLLPILALLLVSIIKHFNLLS